jgi:hypothetical protein
MPRQEEEAQQSLNPRSRQKQWKVAARIFVVVERTRVSLGEHWWVDHKSHNVRKKQDTGVTGQEPPLLNDG